MRFLSLFLISFIIYLSVPFSFSHSSVPLSPSDLESDLAPLVSSTTPQTPIDIIDDPIHKRAWMQKERLLLIDTETTGLTARDRIIQISVYEIVGGGFTGRTFNSYINPCRSISTRAYQAHHLEKDFLKHQPKFSDIFPSFRKFCGENPFFIAHNAQFDMRLLRQEVERLQQTTPWTVEFKCTLGMLRRDHKRDQNRKKYIPSPEKKQQILRPLSEIDREKILKEKEAIKSAKEWKRESALGTKLQILSSKKKRNERKQARHAKKRTREDQDKENKSSNSQKIQDNTALDQDQKQKKKRRTLRTRPSFKLGEVMGRLGMTPEDAVKNHGHSFQQLCDNQKIPADRRNYHDAFFDTAGLVALTDHLKIPTQKT